MLAHPPLEERPAMKTYQPTTVRLAILFSACLLVTSTGCTSLFGIKNTGPLDNLDLKAVKAAGYNVGSSAVSIAPDSDGRSTVVLEVRDGKKHLERIPLPADKATYIGDVVKDAKLTERLGRINLAIMRPTGNNAPPVRMPVEFDSKGKYVMEEQNYSLRSGDHIIVYPDDNSAIDRLLSSMAPWAKTGR